MSVGLVDVDGKAKYKPGSLRHFFTSTASANGVPIREVSRWLGRKSIKITVDIFARRRLIKHAGQRGRSPVSPVPSAFPC
ncbi:hypothetical protein ABZ619_26000 [Streptomyces sp. NPDC007851]|uniref:hypothetical protein n=1 Tax=Streptomyces sp. NPDC007851 TaxID=3155008 RepID=UPI0033E05A51